MSLRERLAVAGINGLVDILKFAVKQLANRRKYTPEEEARVQAENNKDPEGARRRIAERKAGLR